MITLEGKEIDARELYVNWRFHVRSARPYSPPFREMLDSMHKEFEMQKDKTDNPSTIAVKAVLDARDEEWHVCADEKGLEELEFIYHVYNQVLVCPLRRTDEVTEKEDF